MTHSNNQHGRHRRKNPTVSLKNKRFLTATAATLAVTGGIQLMNAAVSSAEVNPLPDWAKTAPDGRVHYGFDIAVPDGGRRVFRDGASIWNQKLGRDLLVESENPQVPIAMGTLPSSGEFAAASSTGILIDRNANLFKVRNAWDQNQSNVRRAYPDYQSFENTMLSKYVPRAAHEWGHAMGLGHASDARTMQNPKPATQDELMRGQGTVGEKPGWGVAPGPNQAEVAEVAKHYSNGSGSSASTSSASRGSSTGGDETFYNGYGDPVRVNAEGKVWDDETQRYWPRGQYERAFGGPLTQTSPGASTGSQGAGNDNPQQNAQNQPTGNSGTGSAAGSSSPGGGQGGWNPNQALYYQISQGGGFSGNSGTHYVKDASLLPETGQMPSGVQQADSGTQTTQTGSQPTGTGGITTGPAGLQGQQGNQGSSSDFAWTGDHYEYTGAEDPHWTWAGNKDGGGRWAYNPNPSGTQQDSQQAQTQQAAQSQTASGPVQQNPQAAAPGPAAPGTGTGDPGTASAIAGGTSDGSAAGGAGMGTAGSPIAAGGASEGATGGGASVNAAADTADGAKLSAGAAAGQQGQGLQQADSLPAAAGTPQAQQAAQPDGAARPGTQSTDLSAQSGLQALGGGAGDVWGGQAGSSDAPSGSTSGVQAGQSAPAGGWNQSVTGAAAPGEGQAAGMSGSTTGLAGDSAAFGDAGLGPGVSALGLADAQAGQPPAEGTAAGGQAASVPDGGGQAALSAGSSAAAGSGWQAGAQTDWQALFGQGGGTGAPASAVTDWQGLQGNGAQSPDAWSQQGQQQTGWDQSQQQAAAPVEASGGGDMGGTGSWGTALGTATDAWSNQQNQQQGNWFGAGDQQQAAQTGWNSTGTGTGTGTGQDNGWNQQAAQTDWNSNQNNWGQNDSSYSQNDNWNSNSDGWNQQATQTDGQQNGNGGYNDGGSGGSW